MKGMKKAIVASFLAGLLVPILTLAQSGGPSGPATNAAAGVSQKTSANLTTGAGFIPGTNLTLPAGSTLHVRLTTTLTSKTNKTGDKFTGVVDQPLIANGKTIISEGSLVDGHVAFIKPSKRIKGKAEMRIVLDDVTTPDNLRYNLAASLEDAQGSPCGKTGKDDEGTIEGCGKSKKDAAKATGIAAAAGAGIGATIGMGHEIDCRYYGNCGGAGMGTDVMYGAGIGAGTALIYSLFKHEKDVILVEGTDLTFIVNRSVQASELPAASTASQ